MKETHLRFWFQRTEIASCLKLYNLRLISCLSECFHLWIPDLSDVNRLDKHPSLMSWPCYWFEWNSIWSANNKYNHTIYENNTYPNICKKDYKAKTPTPDMLPGIYYKSFGPTRYNSLWYDPAMDPSTLWSERKSSCHWTKLLAEWRTCTRECGKWRHIRFRQSTH